MRLLKLPTGDWIHPEKVVSIVNRENWDGTNYNRIYTVTMSDQTVHRIACGEKESVAAKVNELAAQINECLMESQPAKGKPPGSPEDLLPPAP